MCVGSVVVRDGGDGGVLGRGRAASPALPGQDGSPHQPAPPAGVATVRAGFEVPAMTMIRSPVCTDTLAVFGLVVPVQVVALVVTRVGGVVAMSAAHEGVRAAHLALQFQLPVVDAAGVQLQHHRGTPCQLDSHAL